MEAGQKKILAKEETVGVGFPLFRLPSGLLSLEYRGLYFHGYMRQEYDANHLRPSCV